ncbi:MAG: DUF1499 domain-containing protein [Smithellaceae bacterium]|jgi:uncharacterized protein (DUF1499 family)
MEKSRIVFLIAASGFVVAVISALISLIAGLGTRFQWFFFRTGLEIMGIAVIVGLVAGAISIIGLVTYFFTPLNKGIYLSILGLIISIPVAVIPLYMRYEIKVPPIHDITTDITNPPAFVHVLPLRKNAYNKPEYGGPDVAAQQTKAYPDIKTLALDMATDKAFSKALDIAKNMSWEIVAAEPKEGRIEATATTFWMGYKDDIVIRIKAYDKMSNVDIRSESRVGKSDFGVNAKRIRIFLSEMQK